MFHTNDENDYALNMKLPRAMAERLKKIAKANCVSLASVVRQMISMTFAKMDEEKQNNEN